MSCNKRIYEIGDPCRKSIGGIKRIVAVSKDEVEYINYDKGNSDMINFILLKHACQFSKINFIKDSASLTTTYTADPTIGNGEYTSELVFKVSDLEYGLLNTENVENAAVVFIVQNYRDEYFMVGYENPAYLTNSVHTTGASIGDFSGEEMTFTCTSSKTLYKCVVGYDMTDDAGTSPYISENVLNGTLTEWSALELDCGDLNESDYRDIQIRDCSDKGFGLDIFMTQETDELFSSDFELILIDSGLNYSSFFTNSAYFDNSIISTMRERAIEDAEYYTIKRKFRQYILPEYMNLNQPLPKNWHIVNWETDRPFLDWNPTNISNNANVLVVDGEVAVEVTDDGQDSIAFTVSNISQVSGLK